VEDGGDLVTAGLHRGALYLPLERGDLLERFSRSSLKARDVSHTMRVLGCEVIGVVDVRREVAGDLGHFLFDAELSEQHLRPLGGTAVRPCAHVSGPVHE
jgi:hypothetical protein